MPITRLIIKSTSFSTIILQTDARCWIFGDIHYADIFPFFWKKHQDSPAQKGFGSFKTRTYLLE